MKSKIIIFISLIAYILSDVSILSVATGACQDKKYTFVIKANSNAALTAGSATVTMPLQKILLQLVLIQLSL